MKTLQDKFTEVRLLLTEIEDQMEKDYQRFTDLTQLKFEFEDHQKFQTTIKKENFVNNNPVAK